MSDTVVAFRHRLVVRFRDCDLMGHVNNTVYFTYLEQGRITWWHSLGGGDRGIAGVKTNIVHAECDYRAPAFVHDELEVQVSLAAIGRSSVTLRYRVVKVVTGQLLAEGTTVNVTLDAENRPMRVPDETRALLTRHLVAT